MQHKKSEQGQAIVLLVLLIVGLLAAAGLAVDAGRVYSARRTAQNAADNAALAAALAICDSASASSAALAAASTNGFNNDGTSNTVVVHNPPASGPNSGDNEYVEVVITHTQPATLTQLVYKGNLTSTTRAVGRCDQGTTAVGNGYALIILHDEGGSSYSDPYDRYPLKSKPGGVISVEGTLFVNSASPDAYSSYGHQCGFAGTQGVIATVGLVVGGPYEDCPGYLSPDPITGASSMTDPLATLAAPSNPAGSCVTYSLTGGSATLNPGEYCSINLSNGAQVVLNSGDYYINGGDITLSGNARLTGSGVMLYLTSGDISVTDNADLDVSAPTSGTYRGLAIFMDSGTDFYVYKNASVEITGTIYGVEVFLQIYGLNSGNEAVMTVLGQVIVDSAWVGSSSSCTSYGNCSGVKGDLFITYDEDLAYGAVGGAATIELSE